MNSNEEELSRVPGDVQERYDKQIRAIAERMCEYVRKYGKVVRMPREEWRFGQAEEEVLEIEYNDVTRNQFRYFHGKWWEFLDEVKWEYPLYWREEGDNWSVVLYRTTEEIAGYGFKRAHLEADGETKGEEGGDVTESDNDQEDLILGEEEGEDEEAHWSGLKGAEAIDCDGDAMSISS